MTLSHVVVDGSNIATEGRTKPSLNQLDEAVAQFSARHPEADITVIVDATFGHRISSKEKTDYEERVLNGSIVAPPAGVVGRGDAFILQVAEKAHAAVFSNDSFQEFHGTHTWLFDEDRLWGGKPVTGVGWVFVPRTPVRGSVSRKAVNEAKTETKAGGAKKTAPKKAAPKKAAPKKTSPKQTSPKQTAPKQQSRQKNQPTAKPDQSGRRGSTPEPVNSPADFLSFIGEHQPGDTVAGKVVEFSSHGAYVEVGDTKAYLPLKALGDPPPNRARDFMSLGEELTLEVEGYDPPLRSVDLRLPQGVTMKPLSQRDGDTPRGSAKAPAKKTPGKKAPAKKAPAKKTSAKKAPAKKAPAKKTPAKKTPAKKTPAKKAPAASSGPTKSEHAKATAARSKAR